ncbi:hypothetical protein D3C79_949170 [compost metagenome]
MIIPLLTIIELSTVSMRNRAVICIPKLISVGINPVTICLRIGIDIVTDIIAILIIVYPPIIIQLLVLIIDIE